MNVFIILNVCNECLIFIFNLFTFIFSLFICKCYCIFLYIDPRSVDTSVLHDQGTHKSSLVWMGFDLGELRSQRHKATFHRII